MTRNSVRDPISIGAEGPRFKKAFLPRDGANGAVENLFPVLAWHNTFSLTEGVEPCRHRCL